MSQAEMTWSLTREEGSMAPSINLPTKPHLAEDPTWRAEFRGLFWGEGWLGIDMYKNRRHGKLYVAHRPSIQIAQAEDNRGMLVHLQEVLGGTIYDRKSTYSSQGAKQLCSTWMSRTNSTCRQITNILREESFYVDKKAPKVEAMHEFLLIVEELNGKPRSEEVLSRMDDLRAIVSPNAKRREG
jgi:hypothetical protein